MGALTKTWFEMPMAPYCAQVGRDHVVLAFMPGPVLIFEVDHANATGDTLQPAKQIDAQRLLDMVLYDSTICIANKDGVIRLWDASSGARTQEMRGHGDEVRVVLFPNSSTVLSGSLDTTVRVWNTADGTCRFICEGHSQAVTCMKSQDNLLASGGSDGTIRIWDHTIGQCLHILSSTLGGTFTRFAFHTDLNLLAAAVFGAERTLDIWKIDEGVCVANCRVHTRSITEMRNHNGHLITSGADGKVCTWDWHNGKLMRILEGSYRLPLPSAEEQAAILPHFNACPTRTNPPKGVRGLFLAGKYMIWGALDGALRVWDEEADKLHAEYQYGDQGYIYYWMCSQGNVAAVTLFGAGKPKLVELWDMEKLSDGVL